MDVPFGEYIAAAEPRAPMLFGAVSDLDLLLKGIALHANHMAACNSSQKRLPLPGLDSTPQAPPIL